MGPLGAYIQDGGWTSCNLGFLPKKTQGRSLQYNQQMLEDALLWTLQDILPSACTEEVTEAWRELFRFIGATMMRGLRRANIITWPANAKKKIMIKEPGNLADYQHTIIFTLVISHATFRITFAVYRAFHHCGKEKDKALSIFQKQM